MRVVMTRPKGFVAVYGNSANIMTPIVLGYYILTNEHTIAELSEGNGLALKKAQGLQLIDARNKIFGVTVINKVQGVWVRSYDASKLFRTRREAEAYLKELD